MANDNRPDAGRAALDPATKIAQLRAELDRVQALAERFQQLIESAPDAIVVVDESARIVLVNAQAEKLFGYRSRDLLGKPIEILVPEAVRARHVVHRDGFMGLPAVRPMGTTLDLSGRRRDGSRVPVEISLSPLRTRDGLLVSAAIRDTTDRRQAQEALERARGEFDRRVQDGAADLRRSLLARTRNQRLAPVPVDIDAMSARVAQLLRSTLGEAIDVRTLAAADLPHALVDPLHLVKALLELAVSARAAMPAGGRLTIESAAVVLDAEAAAREAGVAPGSYVVLAITDTGPGMTPDDAARVFAPDLGSAQSGGAASLGLATVHGFIAQSGGYTRVRSAPGVGTSISLFLPAAATEAGGG
jgi:PAS domain S-box-containing protein